MSASTAIGAVSESLRSLLDGEIELQRKVNVTILAPDEPGGDPPRINLFLYKVQENSTLKNMDWQVKPGAPNQLVPPPLSLNLFYLLTPYARSDPPTGNITAHAILGEAMRVFYENPVVPEAYLHQDLQDAQEQIKIMLNTLDLDELSRVWSTFTQPFRLSVMYEVSVVQLDMLSASERAMATRVRHIGPPIVRAPYRPPIVEGIEPTSGVAGTSVTVYGQNLAGRTAYVRVMGRRILEAQDLAEDVFEVPLPDDLPPGFHEIRVDISHLCRRTFFFEVTPAVDRLEPLRGPAGTVVTFYGRDLAGQQAEVEIGDLTLLEAEQFTADEFQVTIPDDLPAGSHEIQVKISGVYERTFSFEVTA